MAAPAFHSPLVSAESLISQMPHALWRADQMACGQSVVTASGHAGLDRELPNGGWPASSLIELLLQQAGIGELQLLRPALAAIARTRPVVLIHPPHLPQVAAWCGWGLPQERLLWLKTGCSADALWSAEQVLRNGSCGALLIWQAQIRPEALRRLHLAAQAAQTLLWMMRPLAQACEPSPAPLRLGLRPGLRPDTGGIEITIVKRRGPQRDAPLFLPLAGMPAAIHVAPVSHALVDRFVPAAVAAGKLPAALV